MEGETSVADLEEQQRHIKKELKKRQRAAAQARKEDEDRKLIAAGAGPRAAKEKALKEATWYQAEGKKRPHSPAANNSANEEDVQEQPSTRGRGRGKRQKKEQQGDEGENDGEEIRTQSRSAVKLVKQGSKNKDAKNKGKSKSQPAKPRAVSVESDSSSISDPDASDLQSPQDSSSSDGDLDEDETLDVAGMTDRQVWKVLEDEAPRDPSRLFDNDDNVEMVSTKSGRSRTPSSEASRPPTSESEAAFDDPDNSDEEEELDKAKQAKKAKRPSKRDAALTTERPTIVSSRPANNTSKSRQRQRSNVHIESDPDQENDEPIEVKWPSHACLNTHGALRVQNVHLRAVCRDAIKIVEKTLVTKHAWPELHRAATYKQQVLLDAVKPLVGKDKLYQDVQKRIKEDDKFVKVIGKWVIDRLSHHRGNMRSVASDHIALFQLGINEGCKERVKALLENDVYVYPGEWGTTDKGKIIWLTKSSPTNVQIYLNPGLIQLIRDAYFATPTGFGYKFKDQYVSSHPSQPEPELTIPLVALAATAYYAAIWEWREGKRPVKVRSGSKLKSSERFDGDLFKTVFDRHVETLTALRQKVNTYHSIMSKIYSQVTVDNTPDFGTQIQGNALAVLDLSGLD